MGGTSRGHRLRTFHALAGNRALVRILAAYTLFTVIEYSVWLGMLVYAYSHGGATVAGLVAIAQLVPAAVVAPFMATIADRRSPVFLLAGGYLAQAAAAAAAAVAVVADVPVAAYAAAVIAAATATGARPAQATLIPSVATTPDQLTAANVLVGWVEAAGFAAAGLMAGALIALGGVATVFVVCAGLGLGAATLVARLRAVAFAPSSERAAAPLAGLAESVRLTASRPRLRLMLGLLTAQAAVAGALDLLIVILAVSVLGLSHAWVGYLNFVYGVGAVLAATGSVVLIGRRLGVPIMSAALLLSIALAALAADVGLGGTVVLLALAGASHTVLDVSNRILLQRSVPAQLIGQVFGILEGLQAAGWALGALFVPLLVYLGGSRLALLGVAAVLPLAAALGGRGLFTLDTETPVPVVEIALLRSIPLFAELPAPAIEALAASLTPVQLSPGTVLIRQGDPGDAYYAIAFGELDIQQDGCFLRRCGRGEGVGEIALLHSIPRTATVIAHSAATVYELDREPFLSAVLGHPQTFREANRIAGAWLAADVERASPQHPAGSRKHKGKRSS
jgi:MFS transporter/cyclic nucleotide-binding protein